MFLDSGQFVFREFDEKNIVEKPFRKYQIIERFQDPPQYF